MSLSDSTNLPSEVANTTISSPTSSKLSFDRPSSPDDPNCYLCSSPSENHSPLLPHRASSPAFSSDRSQSPVQSPLSPLRYSNEGNDTSPDRSAGYLVFIPREGGASPTNYSSHLPCTFPTLSLPSPSSSPLPGCDSPSSPSSPPPPPSEFPVLGSPVSSSPSSPTPFEPLPPASPPVPPPLPEPPLRDETWSSTFSPCRSPSPIDLSLSGASASSRRKRPFYSLSPKVEVDSDASPPPSPLNSSPTSPFPTPAADEVANGEDSPHRSRHPRRHHRHHRHQEGSSDPSLVSASNEEVVDVGEGGGRNEGPLCVVDLTCEEDDDDDDVEIVLADQPVVFVDSVASNRRRKRRRRQEPPRPLSSSDELIVIGDSTPDATPTVIEVSDSVDTPAVPASSGGGDDVSSTNAPPPPLPPSQPPQHFGDLLPPPQVIPLEPESPSSSGGGGGGGSAGGSVPTYTAGFYPPDRFSAQAQPNERPPSPTLSGVRSVIEAPIPPHVYDSIFSIEAERRLPQPLSPRRHFSSWTLRRRLCFPVRPLVPHSAPALHPAPTSHSASVSLPGPASHPVPASRPASLSALHPLSSQLPAPPPAPPPRPSSDDGSGELSCPICFESFKDLKREGGSVSSTVCGHIFCTQCLEAHFRRAKLCPTCRKRLNKKQYHRIFI